MFQIVYRELSSLEADLGFSAKALYTLGNSVERHYKSVKIPKGDGEQRQLFVPDPFLKSVQRSIVEKLLFWDEISPYATAYRAGGSPLVNARPHIGKKVLLKLDIRNFFDQILYPLIKEKAFPKEKYAENVRVLLTMLCVYKDALPQGAPTSPAISNIVMRDFDNTVGKWCQVRGISYTRYCDDMSFSGDFDPGPVIAVAKDELQKMGFFLNKKKTKVIFAGQRKVVTGIVVNEKANVAARYKRQIRQEMYYCMKYGIRSHMERRGIPLTREQYIQNLLGRVNYALSVCSSEEMMQYRRWLNQARAG